MENQLLYELYEAYAGELSLYLYSICRDRELAQDLLQEVFLKAMLSLPSDHTNFRAWLYQVARNLCYNAMRDRKREVVSDDPTAATALPGGADDRRVERPPLEHILESERNRRLYEGRLLYVIQSVHPCHYSAQISLPVVWSIERFHCRR